MLEDDRVKVAEADWLAVFDGPDVLTEFDLVVPVWTMSELSKGAAVNVSEAVSRALRAAMAACATPSAKTCFGSL